jgi:glycosyltransferase involved in cell wall biosynthesis
MLLLSLIIPVYNEEENLPLLMDAICVALEPLKKDWEVIFVDDGSRDHSLNVLEKLVEQNPEHVRVVVFRRNFGQTAAIEAGIDHARGDIIVLLDADLQNDPADIPLLLAKLDEGYDLVSGWRKDRQDNLLTRTIPSNMANGLISQVTGVHLHDYGCTLKAYRREALEGFRLYGEMHRFIPVFAHAVGARITELPVHHHSRKFGKTKYGLERTIKVILDLFTVKFLLDYSHKPMRLFGGTGMVLIFGSGILLTALLAECDVFYPRVSIYSDGADCRTARPDVPRITEETDLHDQENLRKVDLWIPGCLAIASVLSKLLGLSWRLFY